MENERYYDHTAMHMKIRILNTDFVYSRCDYKVNPIITICVFTMRLQDESHPGMDMVLYVRVTLHGVNRKFRGIFFFKKISRNFPQIRVIAAS
jgi:hypothetical protein